MDFQVLSLISLKALIKYINMQPDWPLRSLIIYRKLGRIMEYLMSISGGLLWNGIKEDLKSAGRFRFKKLLKESVISKYWLVYFIGS